MSRIVHPLDRYVFAEFVRVFLVTALGFPLLVEVLDLAENVDRYVARNLPRMDIALSYLYWLPESVFLVLPAAVLFATVFTIGGLTRHSEITAAKASGISFHRIIAPIFFGAVLATLGGLVLGEAVPPANQRRGELLQEDKYARQNERTNFAYLAEDGRTYQIAHMRVNPPLATTLLVEKSSEEPGVLNYSIVAASGTYDTDIKAWKLARGAMHVMLDSANMKTFQFDSIVDLGMKEAPTDLRHNARAPEEKRFAELGKYIEVMERAGSDVNSLRVERMLKIAIPVTCIIIVLFGAPLATSTRRGGAAYGIGISLATTVLFLLLINLTRAFGGKGVIHPDFAAWIPGIVFGIFGMIMLIRVRT